MFNRSRKKIILSIMGSLILLFAVTLAVILAASFRDVRQKNQHMLERYVEMYSLDQGSQEQTFAPQADPAFPGEPAPQGASGTPEGPGAWHGPDMGEPPLDERPDFRLSTFYSAAFSDDGSVLSVDLGGRDIYSEEELTSLAKKLLSGTKQSGRSGNLTYSVVRKDDFTLVAFIDNTVSESSLRTLLRNILIVGSIALVILFFVSCFLANRIIQPLEENDRQQKRFISDASHELKTPVAVIGTNAEMLSREIGRNEWLMNIQYENDRMGGLVKQLLDLSRAENAKTPAEMENTDFSRLVTGEALAFESVAFESGKTLRTSVEDGICLAGNPSQLTQLVSILLDNAVRHSAGSDILLELCRIGRTACLRTVNDSEELPKETLEHLFDRFYQADEARSSEGKHYGLGLSIAKAVSENHGGTIGAACENGKIIFTVTLPLQK